jgi:prolyl 4-hydroxylase
MARITGEQSAFTPTLTTTLILSLTGEQRAFTVLLFGSTLAPGDGGETHFPQLGLSVWPRAGDAIAWANVDEDGEPNPRSLHEGRPPVEKEKVAVNVWIADKPFSAEASLDRAVTS